MKKEIIFPIITMFLAIPLISGCSSKIYDENFIRGVNAIGKPGSFIAGEKATEKLFNSDRILRDRIRETSKGTDDSEEFFIKFRKSFMGEK